MSSGPRVVLLCHLVSGLTGCVGEVVEVPPEEEPAELGEQPASGGASAGEPGSPDSDQQSPDREPDPDRATGGSSGGTASVGGGMEMGGHTSAEPDSFTLSTVGVTYEPTTSEYEPGVTTYLLHLGPTNTSVVAVMGGDVIETPVSGLLEVQLSDCAMIDDVEEECLLHVVQFGGSPAGAEADSRLTGYSFRSDFEGTATRSSDGWSSTVEPEGLMLDMNKVAEDGATSYHGVFVSQVWFDCTEASCNVRAHAM